MKKWKNEKKNIKEIYKNNEKEKLIKKERYEKDIKNKNNEKEESKRKSSKI